MKRELFYVGEDRDLIALLEEDSQARGWQWTVFKGYEELAHYLRGKKRSPDKPPTGMELRLWLLERLTPIVLDIDFEQSNAVEMVRDIKTIDGALPLFVVSRQPTPNGDIARVDGRRRSVLYQTARQPRLSDRRDRGSL